MKVFRMLMLLPFVCPCLVYAQPLEEIIVTAQHREQSLNTVPLSLTVVKGQQLELWRVRNIDDLTALTPGLSGWQQGLSTPIYALRGISSNSFGIGGESSVAVFVDEAYVGRINSTAVRMPDVQRVEVLKGPQGTLLGRNASAGAIHYHTRLPNNAPTLDLRIAAGNFQMHEIGVTGNTPLVDESLFLRVTGFYREQRGDAKNLVHKRHVGGEDGHGIRLALGYRKENLDINFSVANQALKSGGLGYETLDPELAAAGAVAPNPFDSKLATDIDTYDRIESDDANLRIDWQASDHWQLRSITAWHSNKSPNLFDVDGSAIFLTSAGFTQRDSKTWSQEIRFSGRTANINWVTGMNYFAEDISTTIELSYSDLNRLSDVTVSPSDFGLPLPDFTLCDPFSDLVFGPCLAEVNETAFHRGKYRSAGVYGDLSWSPTPRLTLSAGLRYSYDSKDFEYQSAPVDSVTTSINALRTAPLNPAGNILGYSTDGWEPLSEDWDDWQPRLAVMFELYPQQSVYLNVSRGYKAGGFEPAATPDLSVFKPETVSSVDLGIRGTIWQGQLYYNMAAFYYDYRGYQVQVIANGLARTINSEGVTGSGVEWELNSHLGRFWQLRLQGDYTDAHFDELHTDAGSAKGNRTILTPRYSVGLLLDYKGPVASWGSLGLGWQSGYQSDIFYTVHNTPDARRGDVQLHHLRLSYFAPSGRWQVDFIARNLFDKDYTIFQQDVGAGPVARRGLPRQVMAEFSARL